MKNKKKPSNFKLFTQNQVKIVGLPIVDNPSSLPLWKILNL